MRPLWNLTLHEQGPREITLAASVGFALEPAMRGVEVPEGQGGLERAAERLAATLCACQAAALHGNLHLFIDETSIMRR